LRKKWTALLLCVAMVFCLGLSGCTSDAGSDSGIVSTIKNLFSGKEDDTAEGTTTSGSGSSVAALAGIPNYFLVSDMNSRQTKISLQSDGSFQGVYLDEDPYPEEYCVFGGQFSEFKQLNTYTYSMTLSSFWMEKTIGEEWYQNLQKYVATDAFGISGGNTFYLYLAGHSTDDLPEPYINWVSLMNNGTWSKADGTLAFAGLYNVAQQIGFYAVDTEPDFGQTIGTATETQTEEEPIETPNAIAAAGENSSNGQLFPDSSSRYLTTADCAGLSANDAQMAINEIYARHGYIFQTASIQQYFEQFDWYNGTTSNMNAVTASFNSYESANVNLLSQYK